MSPWVWLLIIIAGAYILIKLGQGLVELITTWLEDRKMAKLQKEWKEKRRQEREQ